MKIAIIGTGNLGCSIAKGLITTNAITTLYLTKRHLDSIREFEGYKGVTLTTDNAEAVRNSDILILAVQPAHLEKILELLQYSYEELVNKELNSIFNLTDEEVDKNIARFIDNQDIHFKLTILTTDLKNGSDFWRRRKISASLTTPDDLGCLIN